MQLPALLWIQFHRHAAQTAARSSQNGQRHIQLLLHRGNRRQRRLVGRDPLCLQEQLRLREQPHPHRGTGLAPGRIQLARFAATQPVLRDRLGHPHTVVRMAARHRHQILHGYMRRDRSAAHMLLHARGKQLDQPHPPRHPTHAAIETARQFLLSITKALVQLHQQPAFFQRRLLWAAAQAAIQKQSLRFAQRPDHRFDRVPAQLLQCRYPLIAIDDDVMIRLRGRHHHDRCLLSAGRQRCQQSPVALWPAHPKVLQTKLKLVPFQPHRAPSLLHSNLHPFRSAMARLRTVVCRHSLGNHPLERRTGIARRAAEVCP
jgi:hypothetical protein